MMRSLYSAVSGLSGNTLRMDVIGNNIANVNTTGFKAGRLSFAEAFAQTSRAATAPGDNRGGTNPIQIGCGTTLATASQLYSQGSLQLTGNASDLAIQGNALFVVGDGQMNYYTRDGAFQVDAQGRLVSPTAGLFVQGYLYDRAGETLTGTLGSVEIPVYSAEPARSTSTIGWLGNLNADSAARGTILESGALYDTAGAGAGATTLLTDLRDSASSTTPLLAAGDTVSLEAVVGGESVSAELTVAAGTTLADLMTALETALNEPAGVDGVTASLDAQGRLRVTSPDDLGLTGAVSALNLSATDTEGAVRGEFVAALTCDELVGARNALSFSRTTQVYDSLGFTHGVTFTFTRATGADAFNWTASLDEGGTILEGGSGRVSFRNDGSFEMLAYDAVAGKTPTALRFLPGSGASTSLTIDLDGGEAGSFTGLTMVNGATSIESVQDGYASGVFTGFEVDELGRVQVSFSNGVMRAVAQIALAEFANPGGLTRASDNTYSFNANAGTPRIGVAGEGGLSATITAGALEQSNVDLAQEFTDMIIAQRGFQANARVITASDEVLSDLINVVR